MQNFSSLAGLELAEKFVDKEGESVDWEGLEVVADYFGLLEMKSEVTERKKKVENAKRRPYVDLEFRLGDLTSGIRDINYELLKLNQTVKDNKKF